MPNLNASEFDKNEIFVYKSLQQWAMTEEAQQRLDEVAKKTKALGCSFNESYSKIVVLGSKECLEKTKMMLDITLNHQN